MADFVYFLDLSEDEIEYLLDDAEALEELLEEFEVIQMAYLGWELECDVIDMINREAYYAFNRTIGFRDTEIVDYETDEILECFELNFLNKDKNTEIVDYLKRKMADFGLKFERLDKGTWLGEVQYKLYFTL